MMFKYFLSDKVLEQLIKNYDKNELRIILSCW